MNNESNSLFNTVLLLPGYSYLTMLHSNRNGNAKKGSKDASSSSFIGETGKLIVSQLTKESKIRLTRLNLNPKLLSKAANLASHDTVNFDGDDEVDELPEVEKQQMDKLTTIVDAAYRRVDRNRPNTIPTGTFSRLSNTFLWLTEGHICP